MEPVEEQYDVGVIVGRFQVDRLHFIHRDLIDTVIARHPRVIVFLGDAVVPSAENPLSFEARRQMIHEMYGIEIHSITDHWSDETWSATLDSAIHRRKSPTQTVVLYGGRDSFLKSYKGKLPTRELTSAESHSGSQVRALIANSTTVNSPDFRAGVIWAQTNRFPQSHPVVDMAIVRHDDAYPEPGKVLLGRRLGSAYWQFPGGFVDITDPSLEHAVIREAREETNVWLSLPRIDYLGSMEINDWRYRGLKHQRILTSLFLARVDAASAQAKAGDDLDEVAWFSIHDALRLQVIPQHLPLLDLFLGKVLS